MKASKPAISAGSGSTVQPTVPTVETCAMDLGDAWSLPWSELV